MEQKKKDSNQILEFTKEAKNLEEEKKVVLLEAFWEINLFRSKCRYV